MRTPKLLSGYAAITFSMLFWGISFVWTKSLLNGGFPVCSIVFLRLVIASILFYTLFKAGRKLEKIRRGDRMLFVALAFFEPFLYFIGEDFGLQYVDASFAALVIALIPIVVSVCMHFVEGESLDCNFFAGALLSVAGLFVMSFGGGAYARFSLKGFSLLMLAVVAAGGYSIVLNRLLKNYGAATVTTFQNMLAIPFYLVLVCIFDLHKWHGLAWNVQTVSSLVCLAVFCSAGAYMCYAYAAKIISVTKVSIFANAIPIVTLFCAALVGQESITWQKSAGVVIVVVGVILSQLKGKPFRNHADNKALN
jgi:drug/metabolite transporter (DMT)-like permease